MRPTIPAQPGGCPLILPRGHQRGRAAAAGRYAPASSHYRSSRAGAVCFPAACPQIRSNSLVALAFLAWLDDRGTTLGAATQADIDDWLHGATRYRYLLRDFLARSSPPARTARRTPDPDPQAPPARN